MINWKGLIGLGLTQGHLAFIALVPLTVSPELKVTT